MEFQPRCYIIRQLEASGYVDMAVNFPPVSNPNCPTYKAFERIAATVIEKSGPGEFEGMLDTLSLDENNWRSILGTVIDEMFRQQIHWGLIVTFVVFMSRATLYCAERDSLQELVPELLVYTDTTVNEKLLSWIQEHGGWQALDKYEVGISRSSILVGIMATILLAVVIDTRLN